MTDVSITKNKTCPRAVTYNWAVVVSTMSAMNNQPHTKITLLFLFLIIMHTNKIMHKF